MTRRLYRCTRRRIRRFQEWIADAPVPQYTKGYLLAWLEADADLTDLPKVEAVVRAARRLVCLGP